MARIRLSTDRLYVDIGPWEALLAVRGSFSLPLSQVRGATDDGSYLRDGLGLRCPGTFWPGLVAEGTFRKNAQRVLALWRRGQQIVVIELANAKWDRILLGCADAKATVADINKVLAG